MSKSRKRKVKKVKKTLLALQTKFPKDVQTWIDETDPMQTDKAHQEVAKRIPTPILRIQELHEQVRQASELSKGALNVAPPALHICVQFCSEVVQSRYEKSVFSSIIHEADNIVDKVTGDEDDSDFESLMEIEDNSSVFSGLGLTKSQAVPELRILVIKLTESRKICRSNVTGGKVAITYQSGDKRLHEKSRRNKPNYRHVIGFNHVFTFRGASIEKLLDSDIKIAVKLSTEDSSHEAYVILNGVRCVIGEYVDARLKDQFMTNPYFWKEYLESRSHQLHNFSIPLICPNHGVDLKQNADSSSTTTSPSPQPTTSRTRSPDESECSLSQFGIEDGSGIDQETESIRGLESPINEIRIAEPEHSQPQIMKSNPTPSPSHRTTSSPTKSTKSKTSSTGSLGSEKSERRKKSKFSMGKITKLFS